MSLVKFSIKKGTSKQSAIEIGFHKALNTIIDSNITTLIVAVILFSTGTNTVRGFAITLIIGIFTSIFTVVFVSRTIINLIYGKKYDLKKLSIGL